MKKNVLIILFILGFSYSIFSQNEGTVIILNKERFISVVYDFNKNPDKWIYKGSKPCIIDFYADWCGPCKKVAPILIELAEKYKDQIIIYKINTDEERELAKKFGISSIPTIMFIPVNGEPQIARGALSKDTFEKAIEDVLLPK